MKRVFAVFLVLAVGFSLCGCFQTSVNASEPVILIFIYEEENIHVTLTSDEAAKVVEILDGNTYDPSILLGFPSCGFHENVALKVGNRSFLIASDCCNCILDLENKLYFNIPQEDIAYIHSLFESYGGYFPCV